MSRRKIVAFAATVAVAVLFGWVIFRAISPPAPYAFIPDMKPNVATNFRGFHILVYQYPARFATVLKNVEKETGIVGMPLSRIQRSAVTFVDGITDIHVMPGKVELVASEIHFLQAKSYDPDPNGVTVSITRAGEPEGFWERMQFLLPF